MSRTKAENVFEHNLTHDWAGQPLARPERVRVECRGNSIGLEVGLPHLNEVGDRSTRVLLEVGQSGLQVVVWPDGNQEDPIIHLLTPYQGDE